MMALSFVLNKLLKRLPSKSVAQAITYNNRITIHISKLNTDFSLLMYEHMVIHTINIMPILTLLSKSNPKLIVLYFVVLFKTSPAYYFFPYYMKYRLIIKINFY
jgi:hypothetical protein